MKLADLLTQSINRGDNCLLLGENHSETFPKLQVLWECLGLLKELSKTRPIVLFLESLFALDDNLLVPYQQEHLLGARSLGVGESDILKEIIESGISVYGCENNKTDPLNNPKIKDATFEDIENFIKQFGLFKALMEIPLYARFRQESLHNPDEVHCYLMAALSVYARSSQRIIRPNREFSKYIEQLGASHYCIFMGGAGHITDCRDENNVRIDEGMALRLQRTRKVETAFITNRLRHGTTYTPATEDNHFFGSIQHICYVENLKTAALLGRFFSETGSRVGNSHNVDESTQESSFVKTS